MFSFAILAVVAGIVVLFAHNWGVDTGPGILTKIKIFITHCQVGLRAILQCLMAGSEMHRLKALHAHDCIWINKAECLTRHLGLTGPHNSFLC